jgi:hypothetical protein
MYDPLGPLVSIAELHGVQGVTSSNFVAPANLKRDFRKSIVAKRVAK